MIRAGRPVRRRGAPEFVDDPLLNLVGGLRDPIGLGKVQTHPDPDGAPAAEFLADLAGRLEQGDERR